METGIEKGIEKGIEQGELKKAKETALSLVELGFTVDKIAQVVKISAETDKAWLEESVSVAK